MEKYYEYLVKAARYLEDAVKHADAGFRPTQYELCALKVLEEYTRDAETLDGMYGAAYVMAHAKVASDKIIKE